MIRWLLYLAFAFTVGVSLSNEGLAVVIPGTASDANPTTVASWCYSLVNGSGTVPATSGGPIITPLIECFTDTVKGIIPSVTVQFLNKAQADYVPIVGLMMIIAIAYYGSRIMVGDVQRLKASTFILGLKMGGVYIFLDNAPTIYGYMIAILQQLSQTIAAAATTAHSTGFCVGALGSSTTDSAQWQYGLWGRWDCIFKYLLGFSTAGFAAASIAGFLFLMIFSASAGIVIFFMGMFLILSLFVAAFRFIHVYLMAFLSLSFMFCVGYLFVPLLVFRNTFQFFTRWLMLVLGFILTPVMMFAFMGMMLVALDIALFSGPYSVFCMIGGTKYCGTNTASGAQLFPSIGGNMIASGTDPNSNPRLSNVFVELMYLALENPQSLGSGTCIFGNQGGNGWGCTMSVSGSKYVGTPHPETEPMGLQQTGLNLSYLASGAGSTCVLTNLVDSGGSGYSPVSYWSKCPYLEGILVSICVASLLVYIMLSLITYIPSLASSLTSDIVNNDIGSFAGKAISSQVFGEGAGRSLLGGAEQTALGAAKGAQGGGGVAGAAKGASAKGARFLDMLLMGDR